MNDTIIYSRTIKGARAAAAATELAPDLRALLNAIDGKSTVSALRSRLDHLSAAEFDEALAALAAEDLIRNSAAAAMSSSHPPGDALEASNPDADEHLRKARELRAKIKGRREGAERRAAKGVAPTGQERRSARETDATDHASEERERQDAAAEARREAAEHARQEAEEQARRARQEAEEQMRRAAEEQARREAAERARQEAEEQARRARQEAEEQMRRAAEEEAKRKAAERARQEAEEEARRKAAERARQEAEEEARRKATERARQEAEGRARRDAEQRVRRAPDEAVGKDAAELARRLAEEEEWQLAEEASWRRPEDNAESDAIQLTPQDEQEGGGDEEARRVRLRAEAQERLLAEERAWLEAEQQTRRDEEAEAGRLVAAKAAGQAGKAGSGKSRKWGKPLAVGLGIVLVLGLVVLHLISFDAQIPLFEKSLSGQLEQPVIIKALRLSLLPQAHLRLEGVSIGAEGQIKAARINATGDLGNLFSEKKLFKSLELESPVITEEGLGWILFGRPLARGIVSEQVSALNASLESKNLSLPAFNATLQSGGDGAWKSISIESVDKNFGVELTPKGKAIQIAINARSFKMPFDSDLVLEEFAANGTADPGGLALADFKGFIYGGTLSGNARLKWGPSWSLAGELNAKQIDTTRLFPELLTGGRLAGPANYAMQAPQAAKLFSAPHLEGSFNIPWGTLLGVDLGRMVQGGERRGETKFTELSGSFVHDRGATQLRQVRLSQSSLSASGTVDVDADKNVHGRFTADLKLSTDQRRASIGVSGTVDKLDWRLQ